MNIGILVITLAGPQGCGKSMAADLIRKELDPRGFKYEIREVLVNPDQVQAVPDKDQGALPL